MSMALSQPMCKNERFQWSCSDMICYSNGTKLSNRKLRHVVLEQEENISFPRATASHNTATSIIFRITFMGVGSGSIFYG
jgi:hypothetical protein